MGLMALGVVIFVLVYQKKFAEQRVNYQQVLLKASVESQERERERIAAELHDGVGAMLAATKLQVHRLSRQGHQPEIVQDIKDTLARTIREVRTISQGLSPLAVRRVGWVDSLGDYCKLIDDASDIRISFTHSNIGRSKSFITELSLYRVAQELIHNAMQHAHPTRIHIFLTVQNAMLRIEIESDGHPFNLSATQPGMGLLDVRRRLEILRGSLHQDTTPSFGSKLVVEVPLELYHKTT